MTLLAAPPLLSPLKTSSLFPLSASPHRSSLRSLTSDISGRWVRRLAAMAIMKGPVVVAVGAILLMIAVTAVQGRELQDVAAQGEQKWDKSPPYQYTSPPPPKDHDHGDHKPPHHGDHKPPHHGDHKPPHHGGGDHDKGHDHHDKDHDHHKSPPHHDKDHDHHKSPPYDHKPPHHDDGGHGHGKKKPCPPPPY